jgi:hypothetical protein
MPILLPPRRADHKHGKAVRVDAHRRSSFDDHLAKLIELIVDVLWQCERECYSVLSPGRGMEKETVKDGEVEGVECTLSQLSDIRQVPPEVVGPVSERDQFQRETDYTENRTEERPGNLKEYCQCINAEQKQTKPSHMGANPHNDCNADPKNNDVLDAMGCKRDECDSSVCSRSDHSLRFYTTRRARC